MQVPIENFTSDTGTFSVGGVAFLDVEHKGAPLAFVWIAPTYRQTPTILVFRVDPVAGAHILREGLAPGRLVSRSSPLHDPHTLGVAMDMSGMESATESIFRKMMDRSDSLSFVRYQTFLHTDSRQGVVTYLDLTDYVVPGGRQNCANIEFGIVTGAASGTLDGDTKREYLVALTDQDVTIYRFDEVRDDGTFDKRIWMRQRPPGVTGIRTGANGQVEFCPRGRIRDDRRKAMIESRRSDSDS